MTKKYSRPTLIFYFFFQAEDGIRDGRVTGVQTCALPIYRRHGEGRQPRGRGACAEARLVHRVAGNEGACRDRLGPPPPPDRSEERRVGKECRSRWSARY